MLTYQELEQVARSVLVGALRYCRLRRFRDTVGEFIALRNSSRNSGLLLYSRCAALMMKLPRSKSSLISAYSVSLRFAMTCVPSVPYSAGVWRNGG